MQYNMQTTTDKERMEALLNHPGGFKNENVHYFFF